MPFPEPELHLRSRREDLNRFRKEYFTCDELNRVTGAEVIDTALSATVAAKSYTFDLARQHHLSACL